MSFLPLEKVFERTAAAGKVSFPRLELDYVAQYKGLVNHLRANIYKDIDTGLAANSAVPGFYTAHNSEHFDEVVRYAGYLLGVKTGEEDVGLTPYELYVLLIAIRIHDVGNIYGREDHEKKCFTILRNCGSASGDDNSEKKKIALIAQAHGGKTASGSKDTIQELPEKEPIGNDSIRSRLLASIVRFADEICESRCRAANYLLHFGNIPKHSEVFHHYAASISANNVSFAERRIILRYSIEDKNAINPWGCATEGNKQEAFLVDEILERLEKMDRERRYCNRFSRDLYTIDSIRASIEVVDEQHDVVLSIPIPELCDFGYPDDSTYNLKDILKDYCGPEISKKLTKIKVSEGQ